MDSVVLVVKVIWQYVSDNVQNLVINFQKNVLIIVFVYFVYSLKFVVFIGKMRGKVFFKDIGWRLYKLLCV